MKKTNKILSVFLKITIFLSFLISLSHSVVRAQELEPRSLTNVPVGMNFLIGGYGYGNGNTLLDPALPLEDLTSDLHTFIFAYVRAIDFFGMSGKFDVIVPWAAGQWLMALKEIPIFQLSVSGWSIRSPSPEAI